jgi:hypothetical protein
MEAKRMWNAVTIGESYSQNMNQKKSPFEWMKFWK